MRCAPPCRPVAQPRGVYLLAMLILVLAASGPARAACDSANGEISVPACQAELALKPRDLRARLALATALHKLGRKDDAIKLLDQGIAIFRNDDVSRSVLEEKRWFIEKQRPRKSDSNTSERLRIIKCTSLKGARALKACDEALGSMPDNAELLVAKGDALLDLSPPGVTGAIKVYRKALAITPENGEIRHKLQQAESARKKVISACMNGSGKAAIEQCNRGLLKGASDEAAIQARRGDLLIAMHEEKQALVAYRAAQHLEPGNGTVRQKISRLTAVAPVTVPPAPNVHPAPRLPAAPIVSPAPRLTPSPPPLAAGTTLNEQAFSNSPLSPGVTY